MIDIGFLGVCSEAVANSQCSPEGGGHDGSRQWNV